MNSIHFHRPWSFHFLFQSDSSFGLDALPLNSSLPSLIQIRIKTGRCPRIEKKMKSVFCLFALAVSPALSVTTRHQNYEIPNEYIVELSNEQATAQIMSDRQATYMTQSHLRRKYSNQLRGAQVLGAFQKQKKDVLLVKADKNALSSLITQGAKIYPNKVVRKVDVQRPAPWNLAVLLFISRVSLSNL